jgi:2-oxoglutarate ferredoxin oxidoreductase subunit alpha
MLLSMSRISLKIVGAQGQGLNSIGEILAKGFKRSGYGVFGYREYMSLIEGGHSSYQIDLSPRGVRSTETRIDVLVSLNHNGLRRNLSDVKDGGVVVHDVAGWKFSNNEQELVAQRQITVIELPVQKMLKELSAKPVLGNVLITAFVWALIGEDAGTLRDLVRHKFAHKGKNVVDANMRCIDAGMAAKGVYAKSAGIALPKSDEKWKNNLLITGSQAMGIGLIHSGCRFFASYPMTPSSPLLEYIADTQGETGMLVKQAEDEITAAQMMSGAAFMGTRAATGTSGGGFDLMTETLSMNGMIENPAVFVLAQRPGPGTGLPTWTAQGDLLLAVNAGHGEFARCVVGVSDGKDCFCLMPEVFNLAEEFRMPVIVMTDKHIAEALFTERPFNQEATEVRRGVLITDSERLRELKEEDYYDSKAINGVSPRWLPGAEAATYCAQGDEHGSDGSSDESALNAAAQQEKRMRKMSALKEKLPEPQLFQAVSGQLSAVSSDADVDVLVVSWGSNKGVIFDVLEELTAHSSQLKAAYLHYTYLWPLKVERFRKLAGRAKKVILIECNQQGQLGMLLREETGIEIGDRILKYDGRPFFYDELLEKLQKVLP